MVISKDGKRKRKEISSPAIDKTAEITKRTKVHAQRKFAQGQSSSTFQLATNLSATTTTQPSCGISKDITQPVLPPTELITHKRPNTEDFLTFLCFRGTPILPPHLDYFNSNNRNNATSNNVNNNNEYEESPNFPKNSTSSGVSNEIPATCGGGAVGGHQLDVNINNANISIPSSTSDTLIPTENNSENNKTLQPEKLTDNKDGFIPFGVRKRAEQIPNRDKMQALRKKYHDQRIAKLRSKGYVKSRTTIQTRSNINAANVKIAQNEALAEEYKINKVPEIPIPLKVEPPHKPTTSSDSVKNTKKKPSTLVAARKPGLRSNKQTKSEILTEVVPEELIENIKTTSTPKIKLKTKKIGKLNVKKSEFKLSASDSPSCSSNKKVEEKLVIVPQVRQTRNTRSFKTDSIVLKQDSVDDKSESEEYSSEDDEPLAITIGKKSKEAVTASQEGSSSGKVTRSKRYFEKSDEKYATVNVNKRTDKIKKIEKPIPTIVQAVEVPIAHPSKLDTLPSKLESIADVKPEEEIIPAPIPQKRQYNKKKKLVHEIEKSNETQLLDHSEIEARIPRRSRKTKEAATIYMELIGRKLTSNENDGDDDNQSIDSFPELPNVRKTQKMENELKEKYKNNKNEKITSPIEIVKKEPPKAKVVAVTKTVIQKKLEKSFSDSDEEPLATKAYTKNLKKPFTKHIEVEKPRDATSSAALNLNVTPEIKTEAVTKSELKPIQISPSQISPFKPTLNSTIMNYPKIEELHPPEIPSPLKETHLSKPPANLLSPFQRTTFAYDLKDELDSSKLNQTNDLNNKSFEDISLERMSKSLENEEDIMKKLREVEEMAILKSENSAKQMKLTTSSTMRDLMNPLPSMEESGKIFGIASVSLAQSSGPIDTKCTLGKCGSIHKPSLGPVVPTEAILGEQLSSKERRRAKVNMTHEQIQKWLIESCVTPDPDVVSSDLMDKINLDSPLQPIVYGKSISPVKDIDEPHMSQAMGRQPRSRTEPLVSPSTSRQPRSRPEKIIAPREKISTLSSSSNLIKGPSLKAKPVLIKDETIKEKTFKEELSNLYSSERILPQDSNIPHSSLSAVLQASYDISKPLHRSVTNSSIEHSKQVVTRDKQMSTPESPKPQPIQNKINSTSSTQKLADVPVVSEIKIPKEEKILDKKQMSPVNLSKNNSPQKEHNIPEKRQPKPKPEPKTVSAKAKAAKQQNLKRQQNTDRKLIFNQRRTPVYNTKLPDSAKAKLIVNSFGAFSPENETSIYSFDKEDDVIPVATPFRRHSRRESNDNLRHDETSDKVVATNTTSENKEEVERTPKKNVASQPEVSLTLSPEENTKSASIAVQVSLEEMNATKDVSTTTSSKSITEKTAENNDSDSDGHTFYIPLQGTNLTGSKSDQIIQGVAVKLGTEGPEGPNQRVIMHAKLVTKTHKGTTSTPLPETVGNVQELVKSLIAGKESCKSVPIGTVQPRFKSNNSIVDELATCINTPSQSPLQTPQNNSSQLSRVNSNSSLFSSKTNLKVHSRPTKGKTEISLLPVNNTTFPMHDDPAQMVDAPVFRPTEKEFADPMEYIERIASAASRFGLCKIIPPDSFKPDCQLSDEIRFNAYNQYVHRMLNRWGPNTKELCAIKKYLTTQNISMVHPPWIGGMEVDLPRLYHTVQELGGLKDVIEKKKWTKVAEEMCIPKTAHDRVTKLDDIYCKYLLPYDTLSPAERQKLFDEVEADWAKRETKARRNADRCMNSDSISNDGSDDEDESEDSDSGDIMECLVKGRSMPLSAFFRIARNTMSVWFKNSEPDTSEIEAEFWRHVAVRDCHICVHSGSIDSSGWGYGFPTPGPKSKSSPCAKHPWNLKVLTNHSGSILRSLGPVMGVTVPTLQFGMLFSGCCWYRDPHGLPWIEYLHTGASKIWYGVPDEQSSNFRSALVTLVPTHCQNKTIWLPSDTAMVPPYMLTEKNVSLCRTEQLPGEFVVVFPRAYTSSVCTGYVVSESVYFATNSWLETAKQDFKDIEESCEPVVFSLEQLLFAISSDTRSNYETLVQILPMATEMYEKEVALRRKLKAVGITKLEKLTTPKNRKQVSEENECDICRANLYISLVKTEEEGAIYCIPHAIKYIKNSRLTVANCKLIYAYSVEEIDQMLEGLRERINQQKQKLNTKKQNQSQGTNRYGKS